jgi:tetratricopeptide (TPR) repeat protein
LTNYEEAIKNYDKAIEIDPKGAAIWYERARSKIKGNNIDGALADLKNAIIINKEYADIVQKDDDFKKLRQDVRAVLS